MTVILVLATFVGFLLIDFFMSKGKQPVFATEQAQRARRLDPSPGTQRNRRFCGS